MMTSLGINLNSPISMGQGEYVTFYSKDKKLSYETYSAVYEIFNQNSAFNLARNNQDVQQRFDLTKQQVKSIDSDLEVVFIPRTLYELFFIRKAIKEDHDNELFESGLASSEVLEKPFCEYNQVENFEEKEVNHEKCDQYNADVKSQKCWHLASFNHSGDNRNEGVKIACFRLNKALVKSFKPTSEGFTFAQLQTFVEKEIQFLKTYKTTALPHLKTYKNYLDETGGTEESALRSLATRFAYPTHLYFHSIGLDKTEQHLIEQSLILDCCEGALDSVFLYRGSNYSMDQILYKQGVISLSFGSSLFAGIFYDPTSSAMLQMSVKPDAYVIAIPYKNIASSSIFVPKTNTITQMYAYGEFFHGRTMIPRNEMYVAGINLLTPLEERVVILCDKSKEDIAKEFISYKDHAIFLKKAGSLIYMNY